MFGDQELHEQWKAETGGYLHPSTWLLNKLNRLKQLETGVQWWVDSMRDYSLKQYGKGEMIELLKES